MTVRIAAFNVENLFDRARALNAEKPGAHQDVLDAYAALNRLFEQETYDARTKKRMLALMEALELRPPRYAGPFALIRRIRGKLVHTPRGGEPTIVADGRADWVGWCELVTEAVDEIAMLNTARVIRDVAADILAVIEAESRPVLRRFHDLLLPKVGVGPGKGYRHLMVIDGNDDRGIDVGLATREGFPIGLMRSNVDLRTPSGEPLFSRDCPEYVVTTPSGQHIVVLPNHFKSKFAPGKDGQRRANEKRRQQAQAVADIYRRLRKEGYENVVVCGDLNDTPGSEPLSPLLHGTDLKDVSEHRSFTEFEYRAKSGGRGIGTYGNGRDDEKIDYILLSPALFARVTKGGIFRKGAWPGMRPQRWEVYPELTAPVHAASDHHAIWVDLDL
ncbi:MAG: endonuclease/exonuclease/phosphatase family protein [Elioraea sp.]|nr:endonuclease/exonuclease/phosphatase family protein [Elioraea sp.]